MGRDWTSDYNYYFINGKEEYYFYCRLQGWDYIHPYSNKKNITTPKSKKQKTTGLYALILILIVLLKGNCNNTISDYA